MASNYMGEARDSQIPPYAQQFLFAIDIVNYVMETEWPGHALTLKNLNDTERYRDRVYKAFTGDTKDAIDFLITKQNTAVKEKFSTYFENNMKVTKESFLVFAKEYDNEFNSISQMRGLLKYFVTLALLGGHYYLNDVIDGPELAINHIFMKLPHMQFTDSSYWDKIDATSKRILGIEVEDTEIKPNLNLDEYQEHDLEEENHPKFPL